MFDVDSMRTISSFRCKDDVSGDTIDFDRGKYEFNIDSDAGEWIDSVAMEETDQIWCQNQRQSLNIEVSPREH